MFDPLQPFDQQPHTERMGDNESTTILAELHYADPERALDWLSRAFGFEPDLVVKNEDGKIVFARTGYGPVQVAILPEHPPRMRSPLATGGIATQSVQVRITDDIDAHFARARTAGAEALSEPQNFFFGDRAYLVADLEGHVWNFGQRKTDEQAPPPAGWNVELGH
jgi:uncharacterized glyoxalase superfamily protein PhnB